MVENRPVLYAAALRADPHSPTYYRDLVTLHQERGTLDRALGAIERIIVADQYNSTAHYQYAHALGIKGNSERQLEELDLAILCELTGAKNMGRLLEYYEERSNALSDAGLYDRAVIDLDRSCR